MYPEDNCIKTCLFVGHFRHHRDGDRNAEINRLKNVTCFIAILIVIVILNHSQILIFQISPCCRQR